LPAFDRIPVGYDHDPGDDTEVLTVAIGVTENAFALCGVGAQRVEQRNRECLLIDYGIG
jgi:hypothetical protein